MTFHKTYKMGTYLICFCRDGKDNLSNAWNKEEGGGGREGGEEEEKREGAVKIILMLYVQDKRILKLEKTNLQLCPL